MECNRKQEGVEGLKSELWIGTVQGACIDGLGGQHRDQAAQKGGSGSDLGVRACECRGS